MKKSLLSLSLALALGGAGFQVVSPPALAAESKAQRAGRAAIAALYKKSDRAMIKKDMAAMISYLAPDFQMRLKTGQVLNRAQSISLIRQAMSGATLGVPLTYSKAATRILSLRWRGKDAIVMFETTAVASAGKDVRIEQVTSGRDYWTPTSQGWKVRQSVELASKVWLDGKRIN